ncbi:MAG: transferrin-binding protein-like solute binding protein, partial [Proteobacteria bacterium]|nr:transferrin-binding protein-like solute binding protein [Pseudomonadota bacterium]
QSVRGQRLLCLRLQMLLFPQASCYQTEETNFNLNHTIGYATIGTQTPVSVVGTQTATATYVGEVRVDFAQVNVANGTQIASSTYSGELVMPVDFDNMTLGGTITFGDEGTATFAPAPIVGNGFSGTFNLDQGARDYVGVTDNPTGNYAGNFFGSNADDLAGVMSLRGTSSRGAVIGIGGFRGDRR